MITHINKDVSVETWNTHQKYTDLDISVDFRNMLVILHKDFYNKMMHVWSEAYKRMGMPLRGQYMLSRELRDLLIKARSGQGRVQKIPTVAPHGYCVDVFSLYHGKPGTMMMSNPNSPVNLTLATSVSHDSYLMQFFHCTRTGDVAREYGVVDTCQDRIVDRFYSNGYRIETVFGQVLCKDPQSIELMPAHISDWKLVYSEEVL